MIVVSQFIERPTAEESPKLAALSKDAKKADLTQGMRANDALKTKEFYILWMIFFINIACGLGLISVVAPMAQDMTGMSAEMAAVIVGLMVIFNGFGRLLWASFGRPLTFLIIFGVSIIMPLSLILLPNPISFVIAMAILMTCYGAGFSLIPPYLSDIYGAKELASLHGYILTAWAMAALFGPMLLSLTFEATGSYIFTLIVFISLYLLALVMAFYLKKQVKK